MLLAFFNNLPELLMWGSWTAIVFWTGTRFQKWRDGKGTTRS